ncbi:hypothetical protein H6P81_008779 [Aristolochia fimbriata]|uniref:Uncharacterized protein n=1 Tax=Aristolochia fimbriata TaxID=158543 RepID=A0AAV7EJB7_ARIFI|nr:hypothetical protein H6P81_008779 [Aristolochia fimbriata]
MAMPRGGRSVPTTTALAAILLVICFAISATESRPPLYPLSDHQGIILEHLRRRGGTGRELRSSQILPPTPTAGQNGRQNAPPPPSFIHSCHDIYVVVVVVVVAEDHIRLEAARRIPVAGLGGSGVRRRARRIPCGSRFGGSECST